MKQHVLASDILVSTTMPPVALTIHHGLTNTSHHLVYGPAPFPYMRANVHDQRKHDREAEVLCALNLSNLMPKTTAPISVIASQHHNLTQLHNMVEQIHQNVYHNVDGLWRCLSNWYKSYGLLFWKEMFRDHLGQARQFLQSLPTRFPLLTAEAVHQFFSARIRMVLRKEKAGAPVTRQEQARLEAIYRRSLNKRIAHNEAYSDWMDTVLIGIRTVFGALVLVILSTTMVVIIRKKRSRGRYQRHEHSELHSRLDPLESAGIELETIQRLSLTSTPPVRVAELTQPPLAEHEQIILATATIPGHKVVELTEENLKQHTRHVSPGASIRPA